MSLFKILGLGLLALPSLVFAQTIFTPANPSDAPAGLVYEVKQVPVKDTREFSHLRVAILAAHGVQESELTYPYEYLTSRGAKVDIVIPAWSEGKVMAVSYLKPTLWVKGSRTFDEAMSTSYDLLVLTGGAWNSNVVRKDTSAIKLIKKNFAEGRIISAICAGSQILIDAGLAHGTTLTGTGAIATDLKNAGAIYLDRPAVTDGRIVTGRGPAEVKEFMLAIHQVLK